MFLRRVTTAFATKRLCGKPKSTTSINSHSGRKPAEKLEGIFYLHSKFLRNGYGEIKIPCFNRCLNFVPLCLFFF